MTDFKCSSRIIGIENESTDELTYERTNRWMYGQVDVWTDEHTDRRIYGQTNIWTGGSTNRWAYGQTDVGLWTNVMLASRDSQWTQGAILHKVAH